VTELGEGTADLASVLSQVVQQVLDAQLRLGATVFRDMLGLHFSSARPLEDELQQHPLAGYLIGVVDRAQAAGAVTSSASAAEHATFFLTGLFALLATGIDDAEVLNRYVTTIVKGMENR